MSGKYTNGKAKKKKHTGLWIAAFLSLCLVLALILMFFGPSREEADSKTEFQDGNYVVYQGQIATEENTQGSRIADVSIPVTEGLEIQTVGAYTGIFMEDGSDEIVTDVLMLVLANSSEDTVEYAKITMEVNGENAEFTVTTLLPGERVVLLEKNRMTYDSSFNYTDAKLVCENLAVFQTPPSLLEDQLSFQLLNGALNVTNISEEDITGKIAIHYKNKAAGLYYGGITYRIVLEGGIKAGEIRQMSANHLSETGSEIMFVTVAP